MDFFKKGAHSSGAISVLFLAELWNHVETLDINVKKSFERDKASTSPLFEGKLCDCISSAVRAEGDDDDDACVHKSLFLLASLHCQCI